MAIQNTLSLEQEYLQIAQDMGGDIEGRLSASTYLDEVYAQGGVAPTPWSATPYLMDETQEANLIECASMMGTIMEKVMGKYYRERVFRALFHLPPEIERLTLVPSGCHAAVPLSRLDLFYNSETNDYKILGIVTGGIDGMGETVEVSRAVCQTSVSREFAKKYDLTTFDPVNECVLTLLHTYGHWANAQEGRNHPTKPSMAIVDIPGSPRRIESAYVVERLREMGSYVHLTDVSDLHIETIGGAKQLVDSHGPVTCVWMRPTADEAIAHMNNGVSALLEATRSGLVCTIGGYRSWPCSTKNFLEVLRTRECRMALTRDENEFIEKHVDETYVVNPATDISAFYDQENWVIRLNDGPDEHAVVAGADMNRYSWRNLLVKSIKVGNAVQAYIPKQGRTILTGGVDDEHPADTKDVNVQLGLYVFEGRMGGVRAICGTGNTVHSWNDRMAMGCVVAHEK